MARQHVLLYCCGMEMVWFTAGWVGVGWEICLLDCRGVWGFSLVRVGQQQQQSFYLYCVAGVTVNPASRGIQLYVQQSIVLAFIQFNVNLLL